MMLAPDDRSRVVRYRLDLGSGLNGDDAIDHRVLRAAIDNRTNVAFARIRDLQDDSLIVVVIGDRNEFLRRN